MCLLQESADGFVEAVEGEKIIEVQWHPELMYKPIRGSSNFFKLFVEAAAHGMELISHSPEQTEQIGEKNRPAPFSGGEGIAISGAWGWQEVFTRD